MEGDILKIKPLVRAFVTLWVFIYVYGRLSSFHVTRIIEEQDRSGVKPYSNVLKLKIVNIIRDQKDSKT